MRRAVAPVAHALVTLNTGMPVCPICFWTRWPIPDWAWNRVPAPITSMSWIDTPPSSRASRQARAARSTASNSG